MTDREILAQLPQTEQKKIWRKVSEYRECAAEMLFQEGYRASDKEGVLHFVLREMGLVDQYKMAKLLW